MPEVKKHTIHRKKQRRNIKKMDSQDVIFITKTEGLANQSLFPKKLKKINTLLENATLLPE